MEEKTRTQPNRPAQGRSHVPRLRDGQGIPLSAIRTKANRNDITQLLPLVDAIPPTAGKVRRPLHKPECVQGNRGYDAQPYRDILHARGFRTDLAKRGIPLGSGLGKTRWVVERSIAWLYHFRRLRTR